MSQFNAPHFQNPEAAREYLEALRWGDGRVCPHCGTVDSSYSTKKPGVYRCADQVCRKDFSVTTKSVMESSHIKLNVWLQAFFLMASSKKGVSAHQLHRTLGCTYKTAWFLAHRIREAMRSGGLLPPMGGAGKTVEADETYIGKLGIAPRGRKKPGSGFKNIVMTLVERGGSARSFHIDATTLNEVTKIVRDNVHHETIINTDEGTWYKQIGGHFLSHDTVNHSRYEYVRDNITTNTVEGYYSIFKRGMKGVYQHCSEKHLHRYLSEFDFRYSNRVALGIHDGERTDLAIKGAAGKRLTYRQPH
jgi:transposase-like protein